MIPQRIEPVFTERYESGESVLSAQVNSVKGVYQKRNLCLWEKIRSLFMNFRIRDWRTFYLTMSRRINKPELADMFPSGPQQIKTRSNKLHPALHRSFTNQAAA